MEAASTIGSSYSSRDTTYSRLVAGLNTKWIDKVFPVFDRVQESAQIPFIMSFIFGNFVYTQLILTSLWPTSSYYHNARPSLQKAIALLEWITWFKPSGNDFNLYLISLLCCTFVVLFTLGLLIFLIIDYQKTRKMHKAFMYPLNILCSLISPNLQHPFAALIGNGFLEIVNGDYRYAPLFVIAVIMFFINSILYYFGASLSGKSIYLCISISSMFNFMDFYMYMIVSPISCILMHVSTIYKDIVILGTYILHFVVTAICIVRVFNRPYHLDISNALAMSFLISSCIEDVLMFGIHFFPGVWDLLSIVVFFSAFAINIVIWNLGFTYQKKMIIRRLSMDDPDFESLGFYKNELKAERYLRVGFSNAADRFIDWSLFNFLYENCPHMHCQLMQFASYFPSEYRRLRALYTRVEESGAISFPNRFLMYEVNKIIALRQSSQNSQALDSINYLKNLSVEAEAQARTLLLDKTISLRRLEKLAKKTSEINSLWEDAIEKFPNDHRIYDEYTRFLAEVDCNFVKAIQMQNRSELVETGYNFAIDVCFKCMVKAFPIYLKKKILDVKGNFIKKEMKKTSSSSSNHNSDHISGSNVLELNADIEEQIAKHMFTFPKLRVALDHNLERRKLKEMKYLWLANLIMLIINIAFLIGVTIYIVETYKVRRNSMNGIIILSRLRFYTGLSYLLLLLHFSYVTGRLDLAKIIPGHGEYSFLHEVDRYDEQGMLHLFRAEDYLGKFLDLITNFSEMGLDIGKIGGNMIFNRAISYECTNGEPIDIVNTSLKTKMSGIFFRIAFLMGNKGDGNIWYKGDESCELDKNYIKGIDEMTAVYNDLDEDQNLNTKKIGNTMIYIAALCSVIVFLLNIISFSLCFFIFYRRVKYLLSVFTGLDSKVKTESSQQILKHQDDKVELTPSEDLGHTSLITHYFIIILILSFCISAINFAITYSASDINKIMHMYNFWQDYASQRVDFSIESVLEITQAIFLNGTILKNYTNMEMKTKIAKYYFGKTLEKNNMLLDGSANAPSIIGYNDAIDAINIREMCHDTTNAGDLHSTYKCASMSQNLQFMGDFINTIAKDPLSLHGCLNDVTSLNLYHLVGSHLWTYLSNTVTLIKKLAIDEYQQLVVVSCILMAVGLILSLILAYVARLAYYQMGMISHMILVMEKRLPPMEIIHNKHLLNFLLMNYGKEQGESMYLSKHALFCCEDGIVGANLAGCAEFINPAISKIFGYKPEQFLGQTPGIIFAPYELERFISMFQMMMKGQADKVYTDHYMCVNEDQMEIPCEISLRLIMNKESKVPHSFICVLKDETDLINKQREAEEAKYNTEVLLYNILPREIVQKMQQGENNINFSVDQATILFLDINHFVDISNGFSPSELLYHLTLIASKFDEYKKKYTCITKIKNIGDTYMAAGGLFSKEDENHGEMTIKFALDCISATDEISLSLGYSFSLRIGVHTGGPITAGVVGFESPAFEIVGEPISIAKKLQLTDEAGRIHISDGTFEMIKGMEFAVEPHNEIKIREKSIKAYFISPMSLLAFSSFSAH